MDLRYPVGPFEFEGTLSNEQRQAMIAEIAATPERMRAAVAGLSDEQLDTPYRPDGWTVRQVVHHVPDSHLNSYTAFQTGNHRGPPDDQGLRRKPLGQPGRRQDGAD